jgi:futalosine hydrolase
VRILIVAATSVEAGFLRTRSATRRRGASATSIAVSTVERFGHELDVLVTGVGMVATAVHTSRALMQTQYDLALNLGVCGTFNRAIASGTVVHVIQDRIAELGAEDGDAFVSIDDLRLRTESVFVNTHPPDNRVLSPLPRVRAVTVNTIHGNRRCIQAVERRFRPDVESMEGAAFMCACLAGSVSFAQVRAISNIVERRNRSAWHLEEAIDHLGSCARAILEHA